MSDQLFDLLDPLARRGPGLRELEDEFYKGVVSDAGNNTVTANTAQAISDYRQALLNHLSALDEFMADAADEYAPVGGYPTPDAGLLTGLPPDDPRLNYLMDSLPAGVDPVTDRRGSHLTYLDAVSYIERAKGRALFGVLYDEQLREWVVYVVGSA